MKKEYIKPTTDVVRIQQTSIICTSPGASQLINDDGFIFDGDGLVDTENDV